MRRPLCGTRPSVGIGTPLKVRIGQPPPPASPFPSSSTLGLSSSTSYAKVGAGKSRSTAPAADVPPAKEETVVDRRTTTTKTTNAAISAAAAERTRLAIRRRQRRLLLSSSSAAGQKGGPARTRRMVDPECTGFEPQNYLKDRCKKCFRLRDKHIGPQREIPNVPSAESGSKLRTADQQQQQMLVLSPKQTKGNSTTKRVQSMTSGGRGGTAGTRRGGPAAQEQQQQRKKRDGEQEKRERDGEEERDVSKEKSNGIATEATATGERGREEKIKETKGEQEEQQQPNGAQQQVDGSVKAKAKSASTTTVLLPRQRLPQQISLTSGGAAGVNSVGKPAAGQTSAGGDSKTEETTIEKGGRRGWQFLGREFAPNGGPKADSEEDLLSLSSYKTANSKGGGGGTSSSTSVGEMFTARSIDSLNSLSYAESFKTGKSPPFDEEDPFVTPTSMDDGQHFFPSSATAEECDARALTPTVAEINQLEFSHLRMENQRLAEQCRRYRHERRRWTEWLRRRRAKCSSAENGKGEREEGERLLEEALAEVELMVSEYREENSALKSELDRVRERDSMTASAVTLTESGGPQELEERLQMSESMCEQLRKEREDLQQEMEEMQDQYRVEEIEEFRELQRELEQNAKNCRILQFKLRKSERQREQLQTEGSLLAQKLQEWRREEEMENEDGEGETEKDRKVAELEQELRVAKEISVKLHNELELAEERRYRLEDELFYHKEKVRELLAQNKWREARNRGENGVAGLRGKTMEDAGGGTKTPDQLEVSREVRDSLEREADLREQLRFTESDLQRTRQRLRELESENDELLQKYTRLADQQAQERTMAMATGQHRNQLTVPAAKRANLLRSISEGSDAKTTKASGREEGKTIVALGEDNKEQLAVDTEQLCYMLASMDAQANRICKQLERLDGPPTIPQEGNREKRDKDSGRDREKRRSLRGDIAPLLEELTGMLGQMRTVKEQLSMAQKMQSLNVSSNGGQHIGEEIGHQREDEVKGQNKKRAEKCGECAELERQAQELRDSSDFYRRKNAELTDQVLEMKDQWTKEMRRTEAEGETNAREKERDLERMRTELEEKQREGERRGEELERMREELTKARERAEELGRTAEQGNKWESRCKEMKAERIRLQAEASQLKRRTEEAMQELEKMRTAHQRKEIGWVRDRLRLEEQLKQTGKERGEGEHILRERVAQLEKEKNRLQEELAQSRKGHQQMATDQPAGMDGRSNGTVPTAEDQQQASRPTAGVRVDYRQIADNALRAAEALQRQYKEYQRQYTMEVQRLNNQLGQLERELADRERRLRDQQQSQQQGQPPAAMANLRAGAMESPSMSSLTEHTTWDSRMLDCSMTRVCLQGTNNPNNNTNSNNCAPPLIQCRTMELVNPMAGAEGRAAEFGSEEEVHREYRRTGSSGTNILYRIRREELSKGKNPSVRQMAKAFESFEKLQKQRGKEEEPASGRRKKKSGKSAIFGLLGKANSEEQPTADGGGAQQQAHSQRGRPLPLVPSKLARGTASPAPSDTVLLPPSAFNTLPRGGRNPFKGMGTRIVDRVRRSLSRSKGKSQSRDATPSAATMANTGVTILEEDGTNRHQK